MYPLKGVIYCFGKNNVRLEKEYLVFKKMHYAYLNVLLVKH